jgi:hypothetical protein
MPCLHTYTCVCVCVCVKRLIFTGVCVFKTWGKTNFELILNFENHFENKIVVTCLDVLGIMT